MTGTLRFPTKSAQLELAIRFGLPHSDSMQDWEYEVADANRFDDFLSAYAASLPDDQRLSLMAILVQCVNETLPEEEAAVRWSKIKPLLETDRPIHAGIIEYWACLDAKHEDEMFRVTAWMRSLIAGP